MREREKGVKGEGWEGGEGGVEETEREGSMKKEALVARYQMTLGCGPGAPGPMHMHYRRITEEESKARKAGTRGHRL